MVAPFPSLKDLYIDRPLPYLIGSKLFMEQEDVGLGELSSEGALSHQCPSCSLQLNLLWKVISTLKYYCKSSGVPIDLPQVC